MHCIAKRLDFYSSMYDNVIVLGGLNTEIFKSFLRQFFASYKLNSLVKEPTCFTTVDNPFFIENMQYDDLTQFTYISKIILEKKAPLKERRFSDITKLNFGTKTCKKQL